VDALRAADAGERERVSQRSRWRLAAALVVVAGALARLWVATGPGYLGQDGDLYEWRPATARALRDGIHTVYLVNRQNDPAQSGEPWQGGWFINLPPVLLYLRTGAAAAARRLDPAGAALWDANDSFHDLEGGELRERLSRSATLTRCLKLPGILADALIGLALFISGSSRGGALGFAAAAAYSLNPAVVYNTGFWGQADGVWIALVCASLALLVRERPAAAACALTLAVLTKPQALAFAPLVALLLARRGARALAGPTLAAAATFLLVFLPFVLHGTFVETLAAILRSTFGGEPYLSCGAANLWFLVDGGRSFGTRDTTGLLGPLTPRDLGVLLFLASAIAIARRAPDRGASAFARLSLAAAVTSLAFFAFGTELHENHLVAVLAFLPFAAPADARLWWLLGALSLAVQANLVLFDEFAMARLQAFAGPLVSSSAPLAVAVAAIQTAALPVAWALFRSGPERSR
jgi:hypothetical protein